MRAESSSRKLDPVRKNIEPLDAHRQRILFGKRPIDFGDANDRRPPALTVDVVRDAARGFPVTVEGTFRLWNRTKNRTCVSTRTADELVQLRTDTIARIDEIQAATEFPAKKISLCGWCEYKDRCPLWASSETLARIEAEETAAKAAAEEAEAEDKSQLSLL